MGAIKKILLTGATGYLGKSLLKSLLKEGHDVTILTRTSSNLEEVRKIEGEITICNIDNSDLEEVFFLSKFDLIIHTAACYGRKGENLEEIVQSNLIYPIRILELAIAHKVKYFINTDTALPKSLNAYAQSKKQFLEWLSTYSKKIEIINLQLEYFYGPCDDPSKFITFILNSLRSGVSYINLTSATACRDFIYIDDVVNAYMLILSKIDFLKGFRTIPIGSGIARPLSEIILEIRDLLKVPNVRLNFGALPMRENEVMYSCADITFLEALGWKQKYNFESGILQTINVENILS